jgi:glycosyltransferase involved in cell wall biosynthesis
MAKMLSIPRERIDVVPLGINFAGFAKRETRGAEEPFRVGYFARVSPEKGLDELAEAYCLLRERSRSTPMRLEAAGYMSPAQEGYLRQVKRRLEKAGVAGEFTYHGALNRDAKVAFLRTLDVLSVPSPYEEPKGTFLLEAMGVGVPVVQPRRGAFPEIVEKTGGGVIVPPGDAAALATALFDLSQDRDRLARLGRCAYDGVRAHYTIQRSVDRLIETYESVCSPSRI